MKQKNKSLYVLFTTTIAAHFLTPVTMKSLINGDGGSGQSNDDVDFKQLRELKVTLTTSSGRACRANCLNKGQYFCASEDF